MLSMKPFIRYMYQLHLLCHITSLYVFH